MQQLNHNGYQNFLKKLIEQKLYESFNAANIPKSFYDYILKNMDMDKMIQKFYVKMAERLKEHSDDFTGRYIIYRKDARAVLGRCYNVPMKMQCQLLGELEGMGYVKPVDKQKMLVCD